MTDLLQHLSALPADKRRLLETQLQEKLRLKRAQQSSGLPALKRVSREQQLPLSFAQRRLWFMSQLEPENPFYNISAAVRLTGPFSIAAFERSLSETIRRHEVLRARFSTVNGEPLQVFAPARPIRLPRIDLSALPESEAEAEHLLAAEAERPFDLSTEQLFRGTLLRLSENEHIVLLSMHHIVGDQWSIGILVREVSALYASYKKQEPLQLPELTIQYVDYAAWQREWLQNGALDQQLGYWRKQLGD